ncbi:MAG TPA: hypothetical protein VGI87_13750, partial [Solirubrobacteraceae bacterium]
MVAVAMAVLATAAQAAAQPLTISSAATSAGAFSGGSPDVFTPDGTGPANLNVTDLQNQLASTDVEVGTAGSTTTISIDNDISSASTHELDFDPASGITVNTPTITNGGLVEFVRGTVLAQDATMTAGASGNVLFASTLDGGHALTIQGVGVFDGAVGSTTALSSLTVTSATTDVTGSITTTGSQSYGQLVQLFVSGPAAFTSTGGSVTFGADVDNRFATSMTVNATSGTTTFDGVVGAPGVVPSLTVNGPAALAGGSVMTTGAQTYDDAVTLGANATVTSTGAGNVTFGSTVNGAHALAVNTAGTTTFGGAVGGSTALLSLLTDA